MLLLGGGVGMMAVWMLRCTGVLLVWEDERKVVS
jgi:hypothetical protein